MKNPYLLLLLVASLVGLAAPVQAEKADRDKDMLIAADNMRADDVKQISSYTGNVIVTKGTILIRAARIDVRQDASGYQSGVITGAPDKPAFFRQKREGLDEFIEVESERIDYDGVADIVKFSGKALFRRLRGTALADEISGELIVYENLTDKFSVDGNTVQGGEMNSGKRVRAILTPKPEAAASAPQSKASVPQNKASAPASPTLRSTNALGSSPQ